MGIFEKLFKTKHKIEGGASASVENEPGLEKRENEDDVLPDKDDKIEDIGDKTDKEAAVVMPDPEEEKIENYKVDTVADFISLLELRIGEAQKEDDDERVSELFYQKVKILSGLNTAGLSADGVKVREMQTGVLGTYDPGNNEIAASQALLSDFKTGEQLFNTVFLHEATHRDGIADEGFCQLSVDMKISAAHGIYEWEKQKTKSKFNAAVGTKKAIELYDIKKPEKLAKGFIEAKLKKDIGVKKIQEMLANKDALNNEVRGLSEKIKKDLREGAPRLHEALKTGNFEYNKEIEKAMNDLGK